MKPPKANQKQKASISLPDGKLAVYCEHSALVPVEDLMPHPKNPNRHPAEQIGMLAKIIKHQGFRSPITVSTRSGCIVAGHARLDAAKLLGCPSVPVDYQDFATEADELAHLNADNVIAELAERDKRAVANIVKELTSAGFDLQLAGIIQEEEEAKPVPQFPIASKLNEQHDYVVIFCDNATDFVFLQTLTGVVQEKSYKNTGVGIGRAVPFRKFLDAIRQGHHSLNVQSNNDHDSQAA